MLKKLIKHRNHCVAMMVELVELTEGDWKFHYSAKALSGSCGSMYFNVFHRIAQDVEEFTPRYEDYVIGVIDKAVDGSAEGSVIDHALNSLTNDRGFTELTSDDPEYGALIPTAIYMLGDGVSNTRNLRRVRGEDVGTDDVKH